MERPTITALATLAGISKSYACEILNGTRPLRRPLAIHIWRATGWRPPALDGLTDEQIAVFEAVEPWIPVGERAA